MKTDSEIAQAKKLQPITEIAEIAGLHSHEYSVWGGYKAKIFLSALHTRRSNKNGKLILVTTMTPTPKGEGKTTVTIGLAQALARLGKKTMLAIREPSLGPIMGKKGGATGGGLSQVLPRNEINLHFTGDMHAITSAHNLLASLLDNHIHHGDAFHIDPRYIVWPRVLDISDRSLRNTVIGLGGPTDGVPHENRFAITPASEVMAIICLAKNFEDLKQRLARIIVAYTYNDTPITAGDLKAVGAMAMLLKDAMLPNLVQSTEGVPAIVHGGPFANIAHGTNSLIATQLGLKLSDYFVTEAGFGSDLGAEKFFDIVCPIGNLRPDAVVLVVTVKALKHQGRGITLKAMTKGLQNLSKHLENITHFNVPVIIAINRYTDDTEEELTFIEKYCEQKNISSAVVNIWEEGGEGGIELAGKLINLIHNTPTQFSVLYNPDLPVKNKIELIAKTIYGANRVVYTVTAEKDIALCNNLQLNTLPICIAKTPYSLSDDTTMLGRPKDFKITVREIGFSAGAGFLVPMTGKITTMPGLPAKPMSENIDIDEKGTITGI